MKIEKRKIKDLKAAPYNPRRISDRAMKGLIESVKRFGPGLITINERTGHVVGGHQRIKALAALGVKETEVQVVDLDESEEKVMNITLNNPYIAGEFTEDLGPMLAEMEAEIKKALALTELELEFATLDAEAGNTDPDAVPEVVEPITKRGDLWLLGPHRVLCGDATKAEDVTRLMNGEKADLLLTDPPYNVAYSTVKFKNDNYKWADKKERPIINDALSLADSISLWKKFTAIAYNITTDNASYYVMIPQGPSLFVPFCLAIEESKWQLKHTLIWVKNAPVFGKAYLQGGYHYKHELILFGWKKGFSHKWFGDNSQNSLWEVDKPSKSDLHPTMKPVELFAKAIKNSSREKMIIYDPFLGSGTTLIAAHQLSRRCYGMEISPHYCDIIVKRWEDFTGMKAALERK